MQDYIEYNIQYFDDFFGEQDNIKDYLEPEERFHQQHPRQSCRLTWGPGCRDHRCSVECRRRWAYRESSVLNRHLHSIAENVSIYFGEMVIVGTPSSYEHKTIRTKFQNSMTAWGKEAQANVKLLAVAEVGENLRMHYHYVLTSTVEVDQDVIKKLWNEAAVGYRTIVSHSTPRSIVARTKYMFKNIKEPGTVRLLRKGSSPRITWGHLDFYAPQGKTAIWKDHVDELKKLKKD